MPENESVTLGTNGIKKLTLNNVSEEDMVVWVYDGHLDFSDTIPEDTPKHDLDAGESLELAFSDCDFKEISIVNKTAAEAEGEDPYGDAVSINQFVVAIIGGIVGDDDGIEISQDIFA